MPLLENKKYALCKIDGNEYCIVNGQFNRHLTSINLSLPQYLEDYEGIKCRCLYCGSYSGVKMGFVPKDTCGSQACGKAARAKAIRETDPELRRQWNAAPTVRRKLDPDHAAKINKAIHAGNQKIGADGLTGYERTKLKREQTLLNKYGHAQYANWNQTVKTWKNKPDEEKMTYAKQCSERQLAFPTEKRTEINETIRQTMQARYGVNSAFALRGTNSGYSKIATSLFEAIDPGDAFFKPKTHEKTIDRLQPDFLIGNKIIEFFGDYWHQNPIKYNAGNTIKQNGKSAAEIWERDRQRVERLSSAGYEVLVVWEYDYRQNPKGTIERCRTWLSNI
jgi:G:T-mismatch repair DNA endonuclease (very short patch repair protein)